MVEFQNVQAAVTAMMVDNNITAIPNPTNVACGIAYNDMAYVDDVTDKGFPDFTTIGTDKGYTDDTIQVGYVLFGHVKAVTSTTTDTVSYVNSPQTQYYYTCESDGTVRQWDDATMTTEYTYGVTTPLPRPTPVPAPVPKATLRSIKIEDIEVINDLAEKVGISLESVNHNGTDVSVKCASDNYTVFRNYITALGESENFTTPVPPPEGYPYTTSGTIKLTPKFQYIDMSTLTTSELAPMAVLDIIAMIVDIAR
ncbi:hypothetical protein ACFLUO_10195, partial [Chloroflexota bacterium]